MSYGLSDVMVIVLQNDAKYCTEVGLGQLSGIGRVGPESFTGLAGERAVKAME
jgi:hypothetical protein